MINGGKKSPLTTVINKHINSSHTDKQHWPGLVFRQLLGHSSDELGPQGLVHGARLEAVQAESCHRPLGCLPGWAHPLFQDVSSLHHPENLHSLQLLAMTNSLVIVDENHTETQQSIPRCYRLELLILTTLGAWLNMQGQSEISLKCKKKKKLLFLPEWLSILMTRSWLHITRRKDAMGCVGGVELSSNQAAHSIQCWCRKLPAVRCRFYSALCSTSF